MTFLKRDFISKSARVAICSAVAAAIAPLSDGFNQAEAATLTDAFLIVDQTAPVFAGPGDEVNPPFEVTGSITLRLNLDTNGVATSATNAGNFTTVIEEALSYADHSGTINAGEGTGAASATRINSESQVWDDVGIVSDGTGDAPDNIDFGQGASVTFNPTRLGFDYLIIAEDAALDPFKLELCSTVACDSATTIFDGFSTSGTNLQSTLTTRGDISASDTSTPGNMDLAYLFLFDSKVTDFVRIT